MSDFNGDWVGKITGTNNAEIFVEISDDDGSLTGSARINDPIYGTSVYTFTGNADGKSVHFEMNPTPKSLQSKRFHNVYVEGKQVTVETDGVNIGHVTVNGTIIKENRIEGKWISSIGTGGVFWVEHTLRTIETASKFKGDQIDNIAFIMMSISPDKPELEDSLNAMKRAAIQNGIQGVRVDEIEHSKKITDVILEKINNSRFLICDITYERPNVYYELGYAHGIGKDVILVAKEGTSLHFDIKDYNVILYKTYSELEKRIARRIEEAIGSQQ